LDELISILETLRKHMENMELDARMHTSPGDERQRINQLRQSVEDVLGCEKEGGFCSLRMSSSHSSTEEQAELRSLSRMSSSHSSTEEPEEKGGFRSLGTRRFHSSAEEPEEKNVHTAIDALGPLFAKIQRLVNLVHCSHSISVSLCSREQRRP